MLAAVYRETGDSGVLGVDGNEHLWAGLPDRPNHRDGPFDLSRSRHGLSPGAGRLGAHVDEVRPLVDHFQGMVQRRLRVEKSVSVTERIRRNVQDAHDGRRPRPAAQPLQQFFQSPEAGSGGHGRDLTRTGQNLRGVGVARRVR